MLEKAARIGEAIRKESGVDNALEAIQYNILRAGSDRTKMSWAK
jgi:sterol 3beta-glucosyltransferase